MIVSKTPLRISFAGGGTDLPSFYKKNGFGSVLSTSIDSYIYVVIKKHSNVFNEKIRLNYSDTELVNDVAKIKNPIIRGCLEFMNIDDHIYISTVADSPSSSGLGSSSSFCVGLLNALYKYKGITTSSGRIAEEAAHIEINILKRPMGKQDHYAAAYGGLNGFQFHADGSVTLKPLHIPKETIHKVFDNMISFWTNLSRPAEKVLAEQHKNNHKNKDILLEIRKQVEELTKILHEKKFNIKDFATVIHKGWETKKKLASQVSNPSIDTYYNISIKNGAYGGKISGAGGGGFLNVFASKNKHRKIINSLVKEGLKPFKFNSDSLGTTVTKID
tara:strand:+ start:5095 stop:6087 length:993 start_codon:yes stop_codon:yes gene_type:complete